MPRHNPLVPVPFHTLGEDDDSVNTLVDLDGPALDEWAATSHYTAKDIPNESWDQLPATVKARILAKTASARADVVSWFRDRRGEEWMNLVNDFGAYDTMHDTDALQQYADRVMESNKWIEILNRHPHLHDVDEDALKNFLVDTNLYDFGYHTPEECQGDHLDSIDGFNIWSDYDMMCLMDRDLFKALQEIDLEKERAFLESELDRAELFVKWASLVRNYEAVSESGLHYTTEMYVGIYGPPGHFHADADWPRIERNLLDVFPEPEEPEIEIPVTPRGVSILMLPWDEAYREGDIETLRWSVGSWVLYKKEWEQERKWQQKEIKRREKDRPKPVEVSPVVAHFPNGYYVVELDPGPDNADGGTMRWESSRMKHCVGDEDMGYLDAARSGQARFFSLRNANVEPVYTLEARVEPVEGPLPQDAEGPLTVITGFPQVKCRSNAKPRGDKGAGQNNANLRVDTMEALESVIKFIHMMGVNPNNVNDLKQARGLHPELFKRQNPYGRDGYGHNGYRRHNPGPTYSFDEPWYPRP